MTLLRAGRVRPANRRVRSSRPGRQCEPGPRALHDLQRRPGSDRYDEPRSSWRRCAEGTHWDGKECSRQAETFKYADAKDAAAAAAKREAKAWRIPTKDELVALVDMAAKKKPRIDLKAFPQTPAKLFWALRPGSDDDLNAWLVTSPTAR